MSEANRLGVACTNPRYLKHRLLVSNLKLLDTDTAARNDFGSNEVIVPTEPRQPTDHETTAFTANPETSYVLRLVSLPISIGKNAMKLAGSEGAFRVETGMPVDLGGGLSATHIGVREDAPGQMNVSKDAKGFKVGDHIDNFPDPSYRIAVLNMGPGVRWHRLTPSFSREELNGQPPGPNERNAHMKNVLEANQGLLAYWLRLDPPEFSPEPTTVDALIFSPVANYLHDGATIYGGEVSTAVFIGTPLETLDPAMNNHLSLV